MFKLLSKSWSLFSIKNPEQRCNHQMNVPMHQLLCLQHPVQLNIRNLMLQVTCPSEHTSFQWKKAITHWCEWYACFYLKGLSIPLAFSDSPHRKYGIALNRAPVGEHPSCTISVNAIAYSFKCSWRFFGSRIQKRKEILQASQSKKHNDMCMYYRLQPKKSAYLDGGLYITITIRHWFAQHVELK